MDKELDAKQLEAKINNLAQSMKENEEADSMNLVSVKRDVKNNRLTRLASDIRDVYQDLPLQNGLFEFSMNGNPQRFVIDKEAYVITDPQTQEYAFQKETRLGNSLLGRTSNRRHMAKLISRYISEKILDQQRLIESEFIAMKLSRNNEDNNSRIAVDEADDTFEYGSNELVNDNDVPEASEPEVIERVIKTNRTSVFAMLTWFLLGILATILGTVVAALYGNLGLIVDWVQQLVDLITKNV